MPQQDADYKKKTSLAIFKQNANIPTENHPAMGMLGAGSIGTGAARIGGSVLRSIVRKLIPSPTAIKAATVTPPARAVSGAGLARIQADLEFLRTNKPAARPAPQYRITGMTVTRAAKDKAAFEARSVVMRDRVKRLARQAELDKKAAMDAIKDKKAATDAGLGTDATTMRTRVMRLARQAELDKKAAIARGTSSTSSYTAPAGVGPKAPVVGKGGRNQVTPAGQAAFEKATGKSMFGPNGEGMPIRQRTAWLRKNQGM